MFLSRKNQYCENDCTTKCNLQIQIILQSYSHQDSMVLAQKQKCRPMKQDIKLRNKPMFLTKEARIYNGAKTASSISNARKIGQLHVKE